MRSPTRPFITAHKNRISKSRGAAVRKSDAGAASTSAPLAEKPSPSRASSATLSTQGGRDDGYFAALLAADAIFGRKAPKAESATPSTSTSNAPTGRILPCLIQEAAEATEAARAVTKPTKRTRAAARTVKKTKTAKVAKTKKTAKPAPARAAAPHKIVETPPAPPLPATPTQRRIRSAIQKKWVLKTELKAGEKWKRRFCMAAR